MRLPLLLSTILIMVAVPIATVHSAVAGDQPLPAVTPAAGAVPGGNNSAPTALCLPAQVRVHPQHSGVPMRLGEWLTLVVSGVCADELKTQLAQSGADPGAAGKASGITLLLNDVPMTDVPMLLAQGNDPGQTLLSFRLLRSADDSENLAAWNTFLRNNESCCAHAFGLKEMQVAIALAIGNRPAAALGPGQSIQFRVEDRGVVAWTFWVLFIAFFVGFALCLRSPTLLRDTPGGSYSLAKSQMAFWGLVVALCFSGVWFVTGTMEQIPNEVLILLGISATTGWLSPYAGASSVSNAVAELTTQQNQVQAAAIGADVNVEDASTAHAQKLKDLGLRILRCTTREHLQKVESFVRDISSDGDGVCVHRVQAAGWTLILGVVFVCEVTTVISMPVFSTNLLLLLGISNGTYLTLKTKEQP